MTKQIAQIEDLRDFGEVVTNSRRAFLDSKGQPWVMVHNGGDRTKKENWRKVKTNAATLRYDEWRTLDEAVIEVARERLIGYEDLRSRGLVYPLNDAMATTVLTYQKISEAMEAVVNIDPVVRGGNDRVLFSTAHLPIPVVYSDYQISERVLRQSRKIGNALDVDNAFAAARRVAEKQEDMLFGSASPLTYGGGTIYTYLTEPNINSLTFDSAGEYWDAATKTAAQIKDDVLAMKQASIDDKHYGPWMLYVPTEYDTVMDNDYSVSGASQMTIRQRIESINGILGVRVVDRLPDDTVLLVQMTRDVVDIVDGMPMQNIEWNSEGGLVHNYKVMTIQIPRVKSDYNGASGIVKLAPSS